MHQRRTLGLATLCLSLWGLLYWALHRYGLDTIYLGGGLGRLENDSRLIAPDNHSTSHVHHTAAEDSVAEEVLQYLARHEKDGVKPHSELEASTRPQKHQEEVTVQSQLSDTSTRLKEHQEETTAPSQLEESTGPPERREEFLAHSQLEKSSRPQDHQEKVTTPSAIETSSRPKESQHRKNVLFLISDDLRPQTNSYLGDDDDLIGHHPKMHTPNLDRLARRSLQLSRAYVQFSLCNPSRASFMTGRRPDVTKVWDLDTYWRHVGPNLTTLPQYFKANGYHTSGFGKIYHPVRYLGLEANDPVSWTDFYQSNHVAYYQHTNSSWWAVPPDQSRAFSLADEDFTEAALSKMRTLATNADQTPFFLAVGFQKPHLPFVFPQRFADHYPFSIVTTARHTSVPDNYPRIAWHQMEGRDYGDVRQRNFSGEEFRETIPDDLAIQLRRAYYSCTSFVDHLVGRLLDELRVLGLENNTIISFIGDHGFHLGENGLWGKSTNTELGTRAPMMLSVPGRTDNGVISNATVEFVDLFPSVVEAAGLEPWIPCPPGDTKTIDCYDGESLLPLIENPNQETRGVAVSQVLKVPHTNGYSLRTPRWRYTAWVGLDKFPHNNSTETCVYRLKFDVLVAEELYDHRVDPAERDNLYRDPQYREVIRDLRGTLRPYMGEEFVYNIFC